MVPIKIECGCGQHYAFDAEPVNGRLASTVACPTCGADGTDAANAVIARHQPPSLVPAETLPPPRLVKLAATESSTAAVPAGVKVSATALGLVDRETAATQARAKISWGDSPEEVTRYLMLQGYSVPEAQELVAELFQERLVDLRKKGVRKIIVGSGMMCVPVIEYLAFVSIGIIFLKAMALGVMVGLWGAWQLLNGILLIVAPKMESGDVASD